MAYFAQLDDNNVVIQVIAISNGVLQEPSLSFPDTEPIGQAFIASIGVEGEWRQTSYNNNFRGTYAGIGYKFDETLGEHGEFVPPVVAEAPVAPPV